jgi:hypothetical protein
MFFEAVMWVEAVEVVDPFFAIRFFTDMAAEPLRKGGDGRGGGFFANLFFLKRLCLVVARVVRVGHFL